MTAALTIIAVWSAAEAAIFFIVADVPISWIAVKRGTKAAVLAALVAALASVIGTLILWWWSSREPAIATATMALLPGIDGNTLAVAGDIYDEGLLAVLAASFQGIPFKLFALEAANGPDIAFLLLAPLLRLPRFLAVALFAGTISGLLEKRMATRQRLWLLAALWIAFYAFYFSAMPG